jgi:hypothetical protein
MCSQWSCMLQYLKLALTDISNQKGVLLGWSTKFLVVSKFWEISRNNFFYFSKFCEISYCEILRNYVKYHEIFVTKLKFSQGKIHFWIFLHFNTTKKINFMSTVHKYCFKASQILCPPTPFVSCLVSICLSNVFDVHIW